MKFASRYCFLVMLVSLVLPQRAEAQAANNNPTGAAGDYNGNITTAGSYDPFTGNASRVIEDIVVAGGVGAYPLKWTRRMNTRAVTVPDGFGRGGGWSHSYQWELSINHPAPIPTPEPSPHDERPDGVIKYPDGRSAELTEPWSESSIAAAEEGPFGTLDRFLAQPNRYYDLLMADGGVVKFHKLDPLSPRCLATAIVDPYGQTTTFAYDSLNRLSRIKEPGGPNARYLELTYGPHTQGNISINLLDKVEAYDGFGHVTQWVAYVYEPRTFSGLTLLYLTRANYSDGTHAAYEYQQSNRLPLNQYDLTGSKTGLISTCDDVRFAGPMKRISYQLRPHSSFYGAAWGEIWKEKNVSGDVLSEVEFPSPTPGATTYSRRERRPGNSTREFVYEYGAWIKDCSDFLNQWSHQNITGNPGDGSSHCLFTNENGKITDKWREVNFRATIRVTHPAPDNSYVDTIYSDPARPHYVASRTDERGKMTEYVRDGTHRVTRVNYPSSSGNGPDYPDYPGNGCELFSYNSLDQIETHVMTNGATENFRYDGRGLKTLYWPPPTPSDPNPDQHPTQYFYYQSGPHTDRLLSVQDPRGNTASYEYNLRGLVTKVTHQGDNTFTQSEYNDDGTLHWTEDELQHRTTFVYDEYKRITQVIKVVNGVEEVTINDYIPPNLSPLSHTTPSVYHVTSPMQKQIEYDYDANFRRKRMTVAPTNTADTATTTFTYDAVGNLETVTEPNGQPGQSHADAHTTFGYDERNRQTTVKNALNETTRVEYDFASNKTKETRPDLTTLRSWDYDALNRLHHAYDWRTNLDPTASQTTSYSRDPGGNVRTITDTKGSVYTYEYDGMNRKISAVYPSDATVQGTETWLYDLAGNLDTYKNPDGKHRHFHYDPRNRQDHSWWVENGVGQDIVTGYDGASRVTSITTNNGETTVGFGYDEANRKLWEDQTLAGLRPRRVKTELDPDGKRLNLSIVDPPQEGGELIVSPQMQDSGSYLVHYEYTERNQPMNVHGENWAWGFNYTYDRSGNITTREAVSNSGQSSKTNCPNYDALNRPTIWEQTGAGGRFALSNYQYDNVNREKATWRWEDNDRGEYFSYEPTNQLASAAYNGHVANGPPSDATRNVSYGYTADKLNRNSVIDNGVTTSYSPNALNQYTSVGGTGYLYDNNFNLTHAQGLNGIYDAANHLLSASNSGESPGPMIAGFVYDGLGRCVKRILNNVTTVFVYDGWKPIAEWDGTWADYFRAWNVYGPGADEILLRQQGKYGYIRFHLDRHGNVAFLVDNDGVMREKYTYDAFGRPKITDAAGNVLASSAYSHCFLFQGREYIAELGIYDYRNRFYHPALGRFLQTDPTGFAAGDMNLFRYCADDPVDHSDPTGEYFYTINNGPNDHTVRVPISYDGSAATQAVTARYAAGIASLSGKYGATKLKFEAYTSNGSERANRVTVLAGKGDGAFGTERGSDRGWWHADGARVFNKDISPEMGARHSVGHFFGFREGYDPATGKTKPGFEGNIMDYHPGGTLNSDQINSIIHPGLGARLANGLGYLGRVGDTSYGVRWARNSGTGNWTAEQTAKQIELSGGLTPNSGEGFHPVSVDKY